MPYTQTTWVDNTTQGTHTTLNNLETQYLEATSSFEQDLFTAFVLDGFVATKDGSIANQLDVTLGVGFLLQADNTLRRRARIASTQVTATPSTTYYLYQQPDGTWYWSTVNSPAANSLAICTVTTDASGNILVVTDARPLNTTLLNAMVGTLFTGGSLAVNGNSIDLFGTRSDPAHDTSAGLKLSSTASTLDIVGGTSGLRIVKNSGASYTPLVTIDASGNISGQAGSGIPTTRAGVATCVPIYTSTTTPTSPPTGSIWAKA